MVYTTLYCTVLYCTVLFCIVMYCTTLHCIVLYSFVLYNIALHSIVQVCTIVVCIDCTFLPMVPRGGTMGLQMDFLSFFSFSFFSSVSFSTPLTFGCKYDHCGHLGGGGGVRWVGGLYCIYITLHPNPSIPVRTKSKTAARM